MNDLASRDSYIQKLCSKVCSRQDPDPRKRAFVPYSGGNTGPSKKNKRKQKQLKENATNEKTQHTPQSPPSKKKSSSSVAAPAQQNGTNTAVTNAAKADKMPVLKEGTAVSSFSPVLVLRKRLHEKIEESKTQAAPQDAPSEAAQAKRARRKLERERRKRKKKEFRMKRLAEKAGTDQQRQIKQEEKPVPAPPASKRDESAIIFNTVETVEQGYVDKILKKKNKRRTVKGNLTPLTGKNYKQLLSRVELRKAKLEELRGKDEGKAKEMEEKMKWTNVLYKAEGLKIKDNEAMLRVSLKKKEKQHDRKKKGWEKRSEVVVQKMQHRQDKRRKNIQRRNKAKSEKKKERARKKGRVLRGDLEKFSV